MPQLADFARPQRAGESPTHRSARLGRTTAVALAASALALVLVAQPAMAASSTAGAATTTSSSSTVTLRNPALHPFSVEAPANTALGSGAIFESASATRTKSLLTGSPMLNAASWSIAVAIATEADPVAKVTNITNGAVRYFKMPSGAQVTAGTDKHMTIVQPDGYTAYECYKMTKTATNTWTTTYVVQTDLRTDGLSGGARASGISQVMGLIRSQEVAALSIPHTLAIGIPDSMLKVGPVWPARMQDSNAATAYKGTIAMGTMMGIPPSVDLTKLGLTAEGMALGKAMQDYGAHVLVRADRIALFAEPVSDAAMVSRMRGDYVNKLFPLLRIVTNNTATNIGGGGTRRQPAAAPFTAPVVAPSAPTLTSVTGGDRSATVAWSAPTNNGGSSITGYTVVASPGGASVTTSGTASSAVVGGLTAGLNYTFTITATNAAGASAPTPASAPVQLTFSDVAASSSFAPHIMWFTANGVGSGLGDGTFGPTNLVSRADFAGFLYRYEGSPAVATTAPVFTDVTSSHASFTEIQWMAAAGISGGTTQKDGTKLYKPSDPISKAVLSVMLYRGAGSPAFTAPTKSPFVDVATTYQFYKEIAWMAATGIAVGTPVTGGTAFSPLDSSTRQVTAMFMHRLDAQS